MSPRRLYAIVGMLFLLPSSLSLCAQSQPAPTSAPASSIPSAPAYQDPLLAPIHTPPGPDTPQTAQVPTPTAVSSVPSFTPYDPASGEVNDRWLSSTYIPVDSWVYPAAMRLYSLGYLDTAFLDMRPWTRLSLLHMLQKSHAAIMADQNPEAVELLAKLSTYLASETAAPGFKRGTVYGTETVYTRMLGIAGPTLRDSFHLGQTFVNDYGRPYEPGFNNITGFSSVNEHGPFSLYIRGEYQHSPAGMGYSPTMVSELSTIDGIPYPGTNNYNLNQATIPSGVIAAQNPFRLQEAVLSVHLFGHEISGGKSDDWIGPGLGGGMAWSNNAEDIYSFRINRVEPLHIPLLSRLIGPLRYDFMVGSLKGHTDPNEPWVHQETASFAPTANVQFMFQRTVIWGGKGHEPITLHTFLKSFFSFDDTTADPNSKFTANDPGARYGAFSFSWRLPFLHHYVTLYTDSIAHDDVTPPSAPRRAAYRPGVYISQFPGLCKLDFRIEGVSTDTSTLRSFEGQFNYFEGIQRQGYTNKGFIMGDWIGREAKGGQAWTTWHISGNEWIQAEYRYVKGPKDFVPGGTSQGQFKIDVVKRLRKNVELDAWAQFERWKAPVPLVNGNNSLQVIGGPLYYPTAQHDTAIAVQVTWYPKLRKAPGLNGK